METLGIKSPSRSLDFLAAGFSVLLLTGTTEYPALFRQYNTPRLVQDKAQGCTRYGSLMFNFPIHSRLTFDRPSRDSFYHLLAEDTIKNDNRCQSNYHCRKADIHIADKLTGIGIDHQCKRLLCLF